MSEWQTTDIEADYVRDLWECDGPEPGEECGRWRNGQLVSLCLRAGTEECEFECPYRGGQKGEG